MARLFAVGQNYIDCAIGALSAQDGGDFTAVWICRLDNLRAGVLELRTSAGTAIVSINADDNFYWLSASNFASTVGAATADGWHLAAISKASGSATPRGHKYVYGSNAWTHTDGSNAVSDNGSTPGASGVARLGRYATATSDNFRGDIAIIGIWNRVLTDAEIEELAFSLMAWHSADPDALWLFDQSATSQALLDFTGNGANQSAVTGTVDVSTNSVPVFSYGAPVSAPHSVPGNTVTLGQAVETDTAAAVTRTKTKAIGQASETDTATALTRAKSRTLLQAVETDTATALTRAKSRTLLQAVETDTATALTRAKSRALGQALETDTAHPLTAGNVIVLGQAVETDTAQPMSRSKQVAVGQAVETDSATQLGRVKLLTILQATETDSAFAFTRTKARNIGQATELDTAGTLTPPGQALGPIPAVLTLQAITEPMTLRSITEPLILRAVTAPLTLEPED